MTSLRTSSYVDEKNSAKKITSSVKRKSSLNENPTPLDFDSFIPWFCVKLQVSKNVVVKRTSQVHYVRYDNRLKASSLKSGKAKSMSGKMKLKSIHYENESKTKSYVPKISFETSTVDVKDAIPVTSVYDKRGRLIEIAIIGCQFDIPRKVIQAFNLCLPFHSELSKLSIKKGGLNQNILFEISKLLPHSHLTEICLDDSCVPDGNYSIILDQPSKIKYLSLKRCGIDDEECKKIAAKLGVEESASNTLSILDLTSNNIGDAGAQAIGEILRSNRRLVYLNLSGNYISDIGVSFILRYLQEFPLTYDDIKESRRRRMKYLLVKSRTYDNFLKEIKLERLESRSKGDSHISCDPITLARKASKHKRRNTRGLEISQVTIDERTVEKEAEKKTKELIGQFEDPFEGHFGYATGNLALTSLNLAYNYLSLFSVRNILKILKYQCGIDKLAPNTGLLRVVIDGNNIPLNCDELYEIDICLQRALLQCEQ